ncbi:uncharacterized protein ColSpa_12135 [Colletotrichum spaethianum]|uniref:Uncharacterized protein n=1 Tax=Colletotrichum spaethianum TaxID=700344 RepID=A0AA37PGY6_9PEZI|nr:uncharacterized protein ColSpa_12135 [Colletotrichum spaethianum]GKT51954.1 hypothetical protein ColSpa_12135 [Colletotrichum spaethianum]
MLFERHQSTSTHPKACGISQRTTEILRVMDVSVSQSKAENLAAGTALFDKGHPEYAEKQRLIQLALQALDTEFKTPKYEAGWFYPSADIDSEGGATHGGQ